MQESYIHVGNGCQNFLRDDGGQVFDKMPKWLYIVCLQNICHNDSMVLDIYIYIFSEKKNT